MPKDDVRSFVGRRPLLIILGPICHPPADGHDVGVSAGAFQLRGEVRPDQCQLPDIRDQSTVQLAID